MRRTVRVITAAGVIVLVASFSAPAFAKTPQALNLCNIVTAKQLKVRFGSPVGAPILGATTLFCTYTIGKDPTVVPGGTFTAIQQYPNLFAPRLDDARGAVEDQLAIDQLSDQDIEDVPKLGNSAYLNRTKGEVVFSATRKLAFILNWSPAPAGTPLTPRQERHLITLAQEVIKRVKG